MEITALVSIMYIHIGIQGYWSHFTTWYLLIALSEFLTSEFCLVSTGHMLTTFTTETRDTEPV